MAKETQKANTNTGNIADKSGIHAYCISFVDTKIALIADSLSKLRESANSDSKSSMGDKYETSRAMAQIEQENLTKQMAEISEIKKQLLKCNPAVINTSVINGTLIRTDKTLFYMSAALGKITYNGTECFVISPQSPLGAIFLNKKIGDKVEFNKQTYTIKDVQ